jgi:hypothetical protein
MSSGDAGGTNQDTAVGEEGAAGVAAPRRGALEQRQQPCPASTVSRRIRAKELARAFPRREQVDVGEYADALRELRAGDVIAVQLNDLSSRALKRRFSLAAKQLGYRITWHTSLATGTCTYGSSRC